MIPTAIFLGLVGGLIPRYRWWSVPVIGVIWSVILTMEGDPNIPILEIWIVGVVFGAANGAVGVAFTWLIVTSIGLLIPQTRGTVVSRLRTHIPESTAKRLRDLADHQDAITEEENTAKRQRP